MLPIRMQKGRNAGLKYSRCRATKTQMVRWERSESFSAMCRSIKGGYSGWQKMWGRLKPSAFEQRFSPSVRNFPQWQELPVRHPRIRFQGA